MFINISETKFSKNSKFNLKNYSSLRKDKELEDGEIAHGGVLSLIHESIKFNPIQLQTNIQAVAYEVNYPFKHVICNVYLESSNKKINEISLKRLISQLGDRFVIVGDMNAWGTLWGSSSNNPRGKTIAKICDNLSLVVINDGYATHFNSRFGTISCIDLTIASANIAHEFSSWAADDLHGSDHFPIVVQYDRFDNPLVSQSNDHRKIAIHKTDWSIFSEKLDFSCALDSLKDKNSSIDLLVNEFNESLLKAAREATPLPSDRINNKRQVFWWNKELSDITREKKKAQHAATKRKTPSNLKEHRRLVKLQRKKISEARRNSFAEFVSSINSNVTSKEAWDKIKSIKGSKSKKKKMITVEIDNKTVVDKKEIAEIFADHFYEVSKMTNETLESNPSTTDPILNDEESYNTPFSIEELEEVLSELTGSSAGEDGIHNLMLKNINDLGKRILLEIFNKCWNEGKFSDLWRSAIVIPIKKPGANENTASVHRGISLLSCTGKVMERLANKRLNYILESRKLISINQSGFRKFRSTADNLVVLEHNIMEGFAKTESTIAIFFDLEKAYDTTSRQLIRRELISKGIKGKMLKYLLNFMESRRFKVSINGTISKERFLETGLPQGSVLSCTLFNIAIETILRVIGDPIRALLYADDLVIFLTGKSCEEIGALLQETLNKLNAAALNNQFTFSVAKTEAMLFSRRHVKNISYPRLTLGDKVLSYTQKFKFLGMIFDPKLNWIAHVDYTCDKAKKSLNVLKVLANLEWGSDPAMLIRVHKALIVSVLDYGSFLLQSAASKQLKKLDVINNQGMRLATGALRTTPVESLHAETGVMKLEIRRSYLGMAYLTKVMSNPDHPAFQDWQLMTERMNKGRPAQNPNRACFMARTLVEYQKISNCSNITHIEDTLFSRNPPWLIKNTTFDLHLTQFAKVDTSNETFKLEFDKRIKSNIRIGKYHDSYLVIYTDGSVKDEKTGFAITSESFEKKFKLPDETSIYTAELCAIKEAVSEGKNSSKDLIIICSDSLSAILAMKKIFSKDQLVLKIKNELFKSPTQRFAILWVPSHKGIEGNELADFLANEAADMPIPNDNVTMQTTRLTNLSANEAYICAETYIENHPITMKDIKNRIKNHHRKIIDNRWKEVDPKKNKLRRLKTTRVQMKSLKQLKRIDAVKITRLRFGHTRLTHGHIMTREYSPTCKCGEIITVEHLFNSCPIIKKARRKYKIKNLSVLNEEKNYKNIMKFTKKIGIYHEI